MYVAIVRKEKRVDRVGARVTRQCRGIINALMQRYNFSEGDVMEMVYRDYAQRHGIKPVYWDEQGQEES